MAESLGKRVLGYAENPNYSSVVSSVAKKVQEYTKDLATAVNNNSKNILPLLIAGLLIGAFFLSNKLQG